MQCIITNRVFDLKSSKNTLAHEGIKLPFYKQSDIGLGNFLNRQGDMIISLIRQSNIEGRAQNCDIGTSPSQVPYQR